MGFFYERETDETYTKIFRCTFECNFSGHRKKRNNEGFEGY